MRQFVADAPKAHESLSTEARRVPVQGTPIPLISVFIASFCFGTIWKDLLSTNIAELFGLTLSIRLNDSATAGGAWHFCVGRLLLLRSKSGPGSTLYQYGFCELAQRQAVLLRQDAPSDRAIKSDRAKVVMTAGCISKNYGIIIYTCREKEITRQIGICKIWRMWCVEIGLQIIFSLDIIITITIALATIA